VTGSGGPRDPRTAARYDALHRGQVEDVAFYVEEAMRGEGAVLELGCGTGRVALAIAEAGIPVIGLDRDPAMVEAAEAKRRAAAGAARRCARFVRADMRAFAFRRRFARIVAPFRSFQTLLTVPDQLAALSCARESLRPDGRLVFDVFTPDAGSVAAASEAPSPLGRTGRSFRDDTGETVEQVSVRFDPATQTADLVYAYDRKADGASRTERECETMRVRWFHRYEMEHLLARAGFAVETAWGGWGRSPLQVVGEDVVWVARPDPRYLDRPLD